MLNLSNPGLLSLITSAAGAVDVVPSWVDIVVATGVITPGGTPVAISTATTTTIVAAPAAGTVRNVKSVSVRNRSAASITVTVQVNVSAVLYEIRKVTLAPGDVLLYDEGCVLWQVFGERAASRSISLSDQLLSVATIVAVTGSVLDATNLKPGTILKWQLMLSKNTTAGVAAQLFGVHFGALGTSGDTVRLGTYSTGAQTAVVDTAEIDVTCVIRSVSAAGVAHGKFELAHNLATAAGFAPTPAVVAQSVSAGFDMTVASLKATLCHTGGQANSATIHQCNAERVDP